MSAALTTAVAQPRARDVTTPRIRAFNPAFNTAFDPDVLRIGAVFEPLVLFLVAAAATVLLGIGIAGAFIR